MSEELTFSSLPWSIMHKSLYMMMTHWFVYWCCTPKNLFSLPVSAWWGFILLHNFTEQHSHRNLSVYECLKATIWHLLTCRKVDNKYFVDICLLKMKHRYEIRLRRSVCILSCVLIFFELVSKDSVRIESMLLCPSGGGAGLWTPSEPCWGWTCISVLSWHRCSTLIRNHLPVCKWPPGKSAFAVDCGRRAIPTALRGKYCLLSAGVCEAHRSFSMFPRLQDVTAISGRPQRV